MRSNLQFEAHDKLISAILFADRKFRVPRYQRPFAWEIDQVSQFWEALMSKDVPYFLGSFIFNTECLPDEGYVDIIDGQQRLLTITILAAVLRDVAKGIGSEKTANLYHRKDIVFEDRDGNESLRILPSETLVSYFREQSKA